VSVYEACTAETHLRMFMDEGIATVVGRGGVKKLVQKFRQEFH
jgi:hypothetical protein